MLYKDIKCTSRNGMIFTVLIFFSKTEGVGAVVLCRLMVDGMKEPQLLSK